MNRSEYTPLMHAVLDGEASPGEAAELTRLLAANPAAQAEFDELQRLFEGLKAIPKAYPPEGLVHAVMTALPAGSPLGRQDSGGIRQPFSSSRVIGTIGEHSMEAPATIPGKSATVHPISQRGPNFRGEKNMSEQNTSSVGHRKIWIGAGVAAAAVIVAVSTGVLPPSGKDTAGTIVPAQRYVAPQNTAADVKLGDPATGQTAQSLPLSGANAGAGSAGAGSAGVGSAGAGSAGIGSAGAGSAGAGSAGVGSAGAGSAGVGSAGAGSAGAGSAGVGSAGAGSAGIGSKGIGSAGVGSAGIGSKGIGSAGVGSAGAGSAGVGSAGAGSAGISSKAVGSAGAGSAGVGSAGAGSAGVGSSGSSKN